MSGESDWEDYLHTYSPDKYANEENDNKLVDMLIEVSKMENTPVEFLTSDKEIIKKVKDKIALNKLIELSNHFKECEK